MSWIMESVQASRELRRRSPAVVTAEVSLKILKPSAIDLLLLLPNCQLLLTASSTQIGKNFAKHKSRSVAMSDDDVMETDEKPVPKDSKPAPGTSTTKSYELPWVCCVPRRAEAKQTSYERLWTVDVSVGGEVPSSADQGHCGE